MNITVEQTMEMPNAVLFVRKVEAALKAEQKKREHFYKIVDESRKMEFINGEIYFQSPAKLRHTEALGYLYQLLDAHVRRNELGFVGFEKTLISLTRNDYEPDICFFGPTKSKKFRSDQMQFPAPDMIVEVLSDSTERHDRVTKFQDYAAHGVSEYWIVNAKDKVVEQYELRGEEYELLLKSGDGQIESTSVEGFAIPVKAIFGSKENLATLKKIIS